MKRTGVLAGKKVILRPIAFSDTDNILKWRNSESVKDNFVFRKKLTKKTHLNWMSGMVKTRKVYQYIIQDAAAGTDVGSVFLRDVNLKDKNAEFGIFIGDKSARGKGFGSEAASLITDFGFKALKLNRIFLRVFPENEGAVKSYEKAGFKKEGIFRQHYLINGKFRDMLFMGRLKNEK